MAQKVFASTVVVVLIGLTLNAAGQDKKYELAGIAGRTFVSDHPVVTLAPGNVVTTGNGFSFEANFGRRLWARGPLAVTAEIPVVFNPDQDLNLKVNLVPEGYKSLFVTPAVRANLFPATFFSPWISFGGGLGYFRQSSQLEFGGTNPGNKGTTTGIVQIGGGLDVRLKPHLTLRVEIRDFDSGVPQLNVDIGKTRQHNLFGGGGIVWGF